MARYRSFRDFDWPLLAVALIICALGVLQIYSATHDTRWQDAWWKQIVWIAIAMGLMWIASSIDYHTLLGQVPLLYGLSIASLIGARRGALGVRLAALDPDPGVQFPDLGICEIGDNINGGEVSLGAEKRPGPCPRLIEIRRVSRDSGSAGDVSARPRHRVDLPADPGRRDSDRRNSMALSGGARVVGRAGPAGRLVFPQGLSEDTAGHVCRAFARSARRRLPGDSIQDRRRRRRHVGPGSHPRHPDTIAVPAGAAHRFHLLGLRRRAWVRGRGGGSRVILSIAHADCPNRPDGRGPVGYVHLRGGGDAAAVPLAGERGDGGGAHARDRNSFAAHEFE